jgi:muramoyltetrapeptide carboxypeptidase LdcA involved in peptidoglycan recycling
LSTLFDEFAPPPRPRRGSTIAVLSASSATQSRFPARVERTVAALGTALNRPVRLVPEEGYAGVVAGSPRSRADALHDLLTDPEVGLIMFSVGGFNGNDLLEPMAEWAGEVPRKPMIGYSDSTAVLLAYQAMTRSIVFYGPAAVPQFGEWPAPFPESVRCLLETVFDGRPHGWCLPDWYTQQETDWADGDEFARPSHGPSRPVVLRPGTTEGVLVGGNVPTLNLLVGTPWQPRTEAPAVLAVEGTADAACPEAMRRWLRHLRIGGVLDRVEAVLIGRVPHNARFPRRMADMATLVADLFPASVPIVADMPFGHTDPIITLPLGAPVRVVADRDAVSVETLAPTTVPHDVEEYSR